MAADASRSEEEQELPVGEPGAEEPARKVAEREPAGPGPELAGAEGVGESQGRSKEE